VRQFARLIGGFAKSILSWRDAYSFTLREMRREAFPSNVGAIVEGVSPTLSSPRALRP